MCQKHINNINETNNINLKEDEVRRIYRFNSDIKFIYLRIRFRNIFYVTIVILNVV
jgi:hypothetical protein